jgi:SulP family sulfate permease
MPSSNLIHKVIYDTSIHIGQLHFATVLIGVVSITIILLLKKMSKSFPGPLVMVAAGVALVSIFNLESVGVRIIGAVPEGLPKIAVPQVSILDISNLLPLALLISLVSFMESMTISKVIQSRKKNYKVSSNKELIGLGMANISGSFFGSFPVSGGFSRTAVNEQTGANTNLASWISAALVGLTLLFFTPLFYNLPTVILAAIIMVSVIGLIDLKTAILLFKTNKKDFAMLMATFLSTLLFGVQIGIITGVVLSLGLVIQRSVYPHLAELGKLQDTNYYRNLSRFPEAIERKDALIFRFDSELYFANINYFKDRLEQMMERKGAELKVIILNAQSIYSLDSSAAGGLEEILENCHKQKIEFYMTEVIGPVRDTLRKTGLYDKIGEDHFLMRVQDALDYFDTHEKPVQSFATQTNQNN